MCNTKDGEHSQVLEGGGDMASFVFRKITLLRVWLMTQRKEGRKETKNGGTD